MRTESLRRVYCGACENATEMWLPFEAALIANDMRRAGWTVETYRESDFTHTHVASALIIGRVVCPDCTKEL